jgi:hypothetical protein
MLSEVAYGGASLSQAAEKAFGFVGKFAGRAALAAGLGGGPLGAAATLAVGAGAKALGGAESVFAKVSEIFGISAEKMAEWSSSNTGFVKSVGPFLASLLAIVPVTGSLIDQFKQLALTGEGYERSIDGIRRKSGRELEVIRNLSNRYKRLRDEIKQTTALRQPEAVDRAVRREEYVSPLAKMGKHLAEARTLTNDLAKANLDVVESYDKFGNAVLKATETLEVNLKLLESAKIRDIAGQETKVLAKYVKDLTGGGTAAETFKFELKRFVQEFPGFGPILAKGIAVTPAKELDVAADRVNRILEAKAQFPLSTGLDAMFDRYNADLEKTREKYQQTYDNFKRVLQGLVEAGLEPLELREALLSPDIRKGFDVIVNFEPRLQKEVIGKRLTSEDIIGTEILRQQFPGKTFDYTAPLTRELLQQAKALERTKEAFVGDIVLFSDEIKDKFRIAGNQGVLQYREGLGWFVQSIEKELLTTVELPFNVVDQFVSNIFPTGAMAKAVDENIEVFMEHVTGAAAGIQAIGRQEFKRLFSLGPRFFGQIPTELLLQTELGYNPFGATGAQAGAALRGGGTPRAAGFGQVPFKTGFPAIMQKYYIEPFEELNTLREEITKGEAEVPTGLAERMKDLNEVLKNNQVALQYRAVIEDLHKSFAESNRVLEENIRMEAIRRESLTQTSGLLQGFAQDLQDIDLGVQKAEDLTDQQRLLLRERFLPAGERRFTQFRAGTLETQARRTALTDRRAEVARARIQIQEIARQAEGFGAVIDPDDMMAVTRAIEITGDKNIALQLNELSDINANTSDTVEGIDALLLASKTQIGQSRYAARAQEDIAKISGITAQAIGELSGATRRDILPGVGIKRALDRLAGLRDKYRGDEQKQLVQQVDRALTTLTRSLIDKVGFVGAANIVQGRGVGLRYGPTGVVRGISREVGGYGGALSEFLSGRGGGGFRPGAFTMSDLIDRALGGGIGARSFIRQAEIGAARQPIDLADFLEEEGLETFLATRFPPSRPGEIQGYRALVESSEFKELKTAMAEQGYTALTTSKNLQGMFAAYGGIQDVFRRAARREERAYDAQIRGFTEQKKSLMEQRALTEDDKDRAKFDMRIAEIAEKIAKATEAREAAGATAGRRGTQEAIGLLSSGAITLAKQFGIAEGTVSAMGQTAAGALIAWQVWNVLVGEDLPDSVKKATASLTKLGEEGGGDFWTGLGIRFGRATGLAIPGMEGTKIGKQLKAVEEEAEKSRILTEEEKDKILKAKDLSVTEALQKDMADKLKNISKKDIEKLDDDKKMIDLNEQQVTTLLAIEENTRKAAGDQADATKTAKEGEKSPDVGSKNVTKVLRDQLDEIKQGRLKGGSVGTQLRDILTVATLYATGQYVGEVQRFGAELDSAIGKSKEFRDIFIRMAKEHPEAVGHTIEAIRTALDKAGKDIPETEAERESYFLNTRQEIAKALDHLTSLDEDLAQALGKLGRTATEGADAINLDLLGQNISTSMRTFGQALAAAAIDIQTDLRYRLQVSGAAAGIPQVQDLALGKTAAQLTPTEQILNQANPIIRQQWEHIYAVFTTLQSVRDLLIDESKKFEGEVASRERDFADATDSARTAIKRAKDRYNQINVELENLDPFDTELITDLQYEHDLIEKAFDLPEALEKRKKELSKIRDRIKGLTVDEKTLGREEAIAEFIREYKPEHRSKREAELDLLREEEMLLHDQLAAMEKFRGENPLAQALEQLDEKGRESSAVMNRFNAVIGAVNNDIMSLNQALMELSGSVIQPALLMGSLAQEMSRLSETIRVDEDVRRFTGMIQEVRDQMIGGAHPLAPQYPTYDMIRAGVPRDQLFEMTQLQQRLVSLNAPFTYGSAADTQRAIVEASVRESQYYQAEENRKLADQTAKANDLIRFITDQMVRQAPQLIKEGDVRDDYIKRLGDLRLSIYQESLIAGEREEEIRPGVWRRRGINFDEITKEFAAIQAEFFGAGMGEGELYEGMRAALEENGGNLRDILEGQLQQTEPLFALNNTMTEGVYYLEKIALNTSKSKGFGLGGGGVEELRAGLATFLSEREAGERAKFRAELLSALNDIAIKGAFAGGRSRGVGAGGEFQVGGRIAGAGANAVPIMAHSGEYVIRASSARSLGSSALNFMNATGMLPGFQEGGSVHPDIGTAFESFLTTVNRLKASGKLSDTLTIDEASFTRVLSQVGDQRASNVSNMLYNMASQIDTVSKRSQGQLALESIGLADLSAGTVDPHGETREHGTWGEYDTETGRIEFAKRLFLNTGAQLALMREMAAGILSPAEIGRPIQALTTHELTHALDYGEGTLGNKLRAFAASLSPAEISSISGYATKDLGETIAELGAAAFHIPRGSASDIIKKAKDILGITYQRGTPYVPTDQLAYLHKGEAVIPAQYNLTRAGANGSDIASAIADKITDAISSAEFTGLDRAINELQAVKIDVNPPADADLTVQIGNLDELRDIISNANVAIGADTRNSEMRDFVEKVDNQLSEYDTRFGNHEDRIRVIETDAYSQTQHQIDYVESQSELESKLTDLYAELKTGEIDVIKADISRINLTIDDIKWDINLALDGIDANINRLNIDRA